jgi:hypothetical protein
MKLLVVARARWAGTTPWVAASRWDVEPAKAPGRGENGADDAGTGMGN